jgi:hypothetical protein
MTKLEAMWPSSRLVERAENVGMSRNDAARIGRP